VFIAFLAIAALVIGVAARIILVPLGILYGSDRIEQVNVLVAGLGVLAAVATYRAWTRRSAVRQIGRQPSSSARWDSWVTRLTALAGLVALIIPTFNLIVPPTPANISVEACPTARTWNTPYIAVNLGPDGNNSRSGPARSYEPNGRFPSGCTMGYAAYCVGDPILELVTPGWVNSRWLRIAKQPDGWRATLARWLSGEDAGEQYVAEAVVAPQTAYNSISEARRCPGGYLPPGQTMLEEFDSENQWLTARADHAPNIGFAIWKPPSEPFIDGDSYHQIYTPPPLGGSESHPNPGAAAANGSKSVAWRYRATVADTLRPPPDAESSVTGAVVVLAIGCLAPNVPADVSTAAIDAYSVSSTGELAQLETAMPKLSDDQRIRLAGTACQAPI